MKQVHKEIRLEKYGLDQKDQTNIRFYVAMYAACLLTQRAAPSIVELAAANISSLNEAMLAEAIATVLGAYNNLGGSDVTAKGVELVEELKEELEKRNFGNVLDAMDGH